MSFFIRVWVVGEDIPFINSREDQIESDMVDIKNSVVIDAEIEGSYLDAGQIRKHLFVNNGVLSVTNRVVLKQSTSTR